MEYISVFDMLKIGVGPSSSHTLGPWRAAEAWIVSLLDTNDFDQVTRIEIDLYGSLSLTGKGHATDMALILGLSGCDPERMPVEDIASITARVSEDKNIYLGGLKLVEFDLSQAIRFNSEFLPFHSNGLKFTAILEDGHVLEEIYYSIGGGFIVQERNDQQAAEIVNDKTYPYPIEKATNLSGYCKNTGLSISDIVFENEKVLRSSEEIDFELKRIWETMLECMYIGCHTEGKLPGGLNVRRRAYDSHKNLIGDATYTTKQEWIAAIRGTEVKFRQILK